MDKHEKQILFMSVRNPSQVFCHDDVNTADVTVIMYCIVEASGSYTVSLKAFCDRKVASPIYLNHFGSI